MLATYLPELAEGSWLLYLIKQLSREDQARIMLSNEQAGLNIKLI